jgi:sugar phosphate isomerase/epimerase
MPSGGAGFLGMKVAVQENLVPGRDAAERWVRARDWGFDGLELRGAGGIKDRLPELRAARAAGMVAASICPDAGPFIGAFDPADRQVAMTALHDLLEVAAEIGAAGVITPAAYGIHSNRLPPFNPPRTPEEDRAILTEALDDLGAHAGRLGVELWLEPLNRYEDHMVNTLAQGAELCRAVGRPSVRLMADFFHMNIEEADIAASLRAAGPLVAHLHFADSSRLEPGTGHTDFATPLASLSGFEGWGAIECRLSGPADTALPAALAYLRRMP